MELQWQSVRRTAWPTPLWWQRGQPGASLLLYLAKLFEHVEHDHLLEQSKKLHFPLRPLACWCGSHEGWRFLEADRNVRPWRRNSCLRICSRRWPANSHPCDFAMSFTTSNSCYTQRCSFAHNLNLPLQQASQRCCATGPAV